MNKSHEEVIDIIDNCYNFFSKEIKDEYKEVVEGFYNLIMFEVHNSLVLNYDNSKQSNTEEVE